MASYVNGPRTCATAASLRSAVSITAKLLDAPDSPARTSQRPFAGSLTQRRGDADRLLLADLGFETVGDPTLFPEKGVACKAERFRLNVARRVAEEELVRLTREVVRDTASERHRVEERAGPDGFRHELGLERSLEFDDDRANPGLR